ncbi:G-type lectin S-receptor-like serine/threonine-protein kinase At4g27290 isoform X1 [Lycium ferocissimum]|uniref:G-type lectin S-receptor-like serine/threonine-protein kinase At4g27290 isoform X1 n=1 Tax=Lycium ferocissimum TaxID=112874 RepID=UPI002814BFDD|nr:G-type lectin S-receptor-like serine/threonine-protein kinase At4g27290 isoform X1 [Lycium ferocissimum]
MEVLWFISYCAFLLCLMGRTCAVSHSISPSQSISDGESLVSEGGTFELGFFSPGSSTHRYLGIWYKNVPVRTVVWVANRKTPIKDRTGAFTINSTGNIVVTSRTSGVIWSTNSYKTTKASALQLLDSGNLILRDEKGIYMWQSFDYPSDTLLPGMKLGWDLRTRLNRQLSSWRNSDDPSPGELSNGIELHEFPEAVVWKGSKKYFRGGPWNGERFSGAPDLRVNPVYDYSFISNKDEVYYTYQLKNKSVFSRLILNDTTSSRQRYVWAEASRAWKLYSSVPYDHCDAYGLCGANAICITTNSPMCQCLEGFKPKSPDNWNSMDWSEGCILSKKFSCESKEVFVKFSELKLPDTTKSWVSGTMNLQECREACLKNCSCMAYSNLDIRGQGSGCALWFHDLIDIKQVPNGGQELYIRIEASKQAGRHVVNAVLISLITGAVVFGLVLFCYYLSRRKSKVKGIVLGQDNSTSEGPKEDMELPFFDLETIVNATDNFSFNNKLGEGGFGPVYKGTLVDGREIAVKRLSKSSGQGLNEFKNEVKLIAKLQHRNLVKLVGSCIDGEEKTLIYEYMANGSLDSFVFDQTRREQLGWSKFFQIISGIARGLLYLHQDSRLRIIHRDLKASNVLLDGELNPKISDFGLARTIQGDQCGDNTERVVGTFGYMAPEYALYGLFSVKSDVFSFGLLLLEVVSGKRNRCFRNSHDHHGLIGYAWRMWTEGTPLKLVDFSFEDMSEILRCIHVSLLCVQQNPDDRPNMLSVVLMLNGESTLAQPKEPDFLRDVIPSEITFIRSDYDSCTANEITFSSFGAR